MNVVVNVHLNIDRWDPDLTEAVRVSRRGVADVLLPVGERRAGVWGGPGAEEAAFRLAIRQLSPDTEAPGARIVDTAYADERDDPRWIVTFEII